MIWPLTFKTRRMSAGSRPAAVAASSMRAAPSLRKVVSPRRKAPTISKSSGETQRARAVDAEPDTDRMDRDGARGRAAKRMRAIEAQIALATPDQPNDLDRLLEGGKRVARLTSRPAVRLNRIPEAAGTEGKLEPPTAEHVEAGCRLSQHRWRA